MSKPKRDANQAAARVIGEIIEKHGTPLPPDLEEAWSQWSHGISKVDHRGMALLRAAFWAGWAAASQISKDSAKVYGTVEWGFWFTFPITPHGDPYKIY